MHLCLCPTLTCLEVIEFPYPPFEQTLVHPTRIDPIVDKIINNILIGNPVSLSRSGRKEPSTVMINTNGISHNEAIEKKIKTTHHPIPVRIPNAMCDL